MLQRIRTWGNNTNNWLSETANTEKKLLNSKHQEKQQLYVLTTKQYLCSIQE